MPSKARDLSDIVSNLTGNAKKGLVVKDDGTELVFGDAGTSEFYGFKYVDTDSDGVKEDLQITTTNSGVDDISVANVTTDLFDESFFASRNLTFTINASGDLVVTV